MAESSNFRIRLCLLAAVLLAIATPGSAQNQLARLNGSVLDGEGAALPGVTVELTSGCLCSQCEDPEACRCCPDERMVATTDADGRFSFSVPPGEYSVSASAEGFSTASTEVVVTAGSSTSVQLVLDPGAEVVVD